MIEECPNILEKCPKMVEEMFGNDWRNVRIFTEEMFESWLKTCSNKDRRNVGLKKCSIKYIKNARIKFEVGNRRIVRIRPNEC